VAETGHAQGGVIEVTRHRHDNRAPWPGHVVGHGGDRDPERGATWRGSGPPEGQAQDISDLSHSDTGSRHRLLLEQQSGQVAGLPHLTPALVEGLLKCTKLRNGCTDSIGMVYGIIRNPHRHGRNRWRRCPWLGERNHSSGAVSSRGGRDCADAGPSDARLDTVTPSFLSSPTIRRYPTGVLLAKRQISSAVALGRGGRPGRDAGRSAPADQRAVHPEDCLRRDDERPPGLSGHESGQEGDEGAVGPGEAGTVT